MNFLGIDLAQRYSAAVLVDSDGDLQGEWTCDFGPLAKDASAKEIGEVLVKAGEWFVNDLILEGIAYAGETLVGIEDVHVHAINPKPAMRVQGLALAAFADEKNVHPYLVKVNDWQRHHGYKKVKGKTSKGWAKDYCEFLGYKPDTTGKQTVDLRDAYLIARYLWATEVDY